MHGVTSPSAEYTTLGAISYAQRPVVLSTSKISSVALKIEAPLSAGAVSRPLEARFQDEFYRASFQLLGNPFLKPEWSWTKQAGWVDFTIPSERWAVECVSDGDNLEEHIDRFETGGKYHEWIRDGEVEEFILLDFRRTIPRESRGIDWLFHVVFTNDFASYTVYDSDCNVIPGQNQIALLE